MSSKVSESMVTYQSTDDSNVLTLIDTVRNGLDYSFFSDFTDEGTVYNAGMVGVSTFISTHHAALQKRTKTF
jgi:hypothetical protein